MTDQDKYHTYVDIWDSDYAEQVKQLNEVGCFRLYPFDNGAPSNRPIESGPVCGRGSRRGFRRAMRCYCRAFRPSPA